MKQFRQERHLEIRRKTRTRQNGFVLLLVAMIMMLIGTEMLVLTGLAKIMLSESNIAYLQAAERNLAASGLAWAERNVKSQGRESCDQSIELDVRNLNIRGSTLSVTTGIRTDKEAEVQINTSCSRGKRTFKQHNKYHIQL